MQEVRSLDGLSFSFRDTSSLAKVMPINHRLANYWTCNDVAAAGGKVGGICSLFRQCRERRAGVSLPPAEQEEGRSLRRNDGKLPDPAGLKGV
ncbi:hypothetical protein chiPu_0006872 [Chiloscyllium punctatum]|uniref:Uncharacterized protein n=1 Tax=Chiloscyllium punctatum TaxID=137246 RepID=A0A401SDE4_CHIPU|nr:hypothetical protein [Chiloscyllium punctatum]